MTEELQKKFWDGLVPADGITSALTERQNPFIFEKVHVELVEKYKKEGWEVCKELKKVVKLRKPKPFDVNFEDEVWALFAKLGFNFLNRDRQFRVPYSDDFSLTQQMDVFAADDETILLVECKSADGGPKKGYFKETIEAIGGKKEGIHKTLRKLFPKSKHKVKFIFATNNYLLSDNDKERLDNFGIIHFDEEAVQYYMDLSRHLGLSAKYQLLGNLFQGQTIPELDNMVPAIQGKMGGFTYYSFSIEPEKLLKIGYVLHRSKANKKLMPTYQRLITKKRLKAIKEFVDEGGFFPNSIVINICCNGKPLRFDRANTQVETAVSKVGVLHLPKVYRSAYIIDGQHRLYGYASSKYKTSNSIPVVAFVDLERQDQLKLFMQINENQKAVPKNLRNTLNSDLLWDSESLIDRVKALKLQLAQDLGEEKISPLYDRVVVGENPSTDTRCITIESIKIGLDRSNFFGEFSKNAIKEDGTFYKGDNDETYAALFPYIIGCFEHIKEALPDDWEKGEAANGYLSINAGIESFIRIFSDIIDHMVQEKTVSPKSESSASLVKEASFYLDPIISHFKKLSNEQKTDLKKSYGTAGKTRYWRQLQKIIHDARKNFNPDGLQKYWSDEEKTFNDESFKIIREIETSLKSDFRERLISHYGKENWFKKGVPPQVQDEATLRATQHNREVDDSSDEKEPWDKLNIIDYRKIAVYGANWRDVFEKAYTRPGEEKMNGGKEEKTKWMQKLEKIRNQNFHSYSVKKEEYDFLLELNDWLIKKKLENDL